MADPKRDTDVGHKQEVRVMNKIEVQRNENLKTLPELSVAHIEVLQELLRSISMGKTTELLIDTGSLIEGEENVELKFKSIRRDLEQELSRVSQMLFMLEKAEYYMDSARKVG